jgi:hypothetical protein
MKSKTTRSIATRKLAELIGVSETTVRNRIKRGRYTSAGRGKVVLNSQVRAEIATRQPADLSGVRLTQADLDHLNSLPEVVDDEF